MNTSFLLALMGKYAFLLYPFLFLMPYLDSPKKSSAELRSMQEHCTEILNKLKKVKGIKPDEKPFVTVSDVLEDDLALAMFSPNTGNIVLQTDTYDICMELLGKDSINGLAFILAHELSHYTYKHNVRQKHIKKFQSNVNQNNDITTAIAGADLGNASDPQVVDAIIAINRKYRIMKNEAEADLDAGFTCFLAGYDAFPAGISFLDESYAIYDIDTTSGNYASLKERKLIVEKTARELDTLIHVFKAANYAMTVRDYTSAFYCYNFVNDKYKSKEILNNLGALSLMQIMDEEFFDHILPLNLELDLHDSYKDAPTDPNAPVHDLPFDFFDVQPINPVERFNAIQEKVNKSLSYLNDAIRLDPDYAPSFINKSIAYYILHDVGKDAEIFLSPLGEPYILDAKSSALYGHRSSKNSKMRSDCLVQLALVHDLDGHKKFAEELIGKAIQENPNNEIAKMNRDIIQGKKESTRDFLQGDAERDKIQFCVEVEAVNEKMKISEVPDSEIEWDAVIDLKSAEFGTSWNWVLKYKVRNGCTIYSIQVLENFVRTKKVVSFEVPVLKNLNTTRCDLKTLDNSKTLFSKYGKPNQIIQYGEGSLCLYEFSKLKHPLHFTVDGMIFQLDEDSNVINWISFSRRQDSL